MPKMSHCCTLLTGAARPFAPGHEVVVPDMEGVVRAWFGRMYLPPRDALLQPEAEEAGAGAAGETNEGVGGLG